MMGDDDDDGSVSGSVMEGGVSMVGGSVVVVVDDDDGDGSGVIGVSGVIASVIGDDGAMVFSVVIIGDDSGGVGVEVEVWV
jgi:hypothetical protein